MLAVVDRHNYVSVIKQDCAPGRVQYGPVCTPHMLSMWSNIMYNMICAVQHVLVYRSNCMYNIQYVQYIRYVQYGQNILYNL